MLIGFTQAPADAPEDMPDHTLVKVRGGLGLAITINPSDAAQDEAVAQWAAVQNQVLTAYADAHDVLPVPLGAVFSAKPALDQHLAETYPRYIRALQAISGCVEYSLTVFETPPPARAHPPAETGRDFLRSRSRDKSKRRSLSDAQTALLQRITETFEQGARDVKDRPAQTKDIRLRRAGLVARPKATEFVENLRAAAAPAAELNLRCALIGPGPAYSFAPHITQTQEAPHEQAL